MQSKTNLFQLMLVMSEILIGSQSVSQTNLSLDTILAVSDLTCWFSLGKKRVQVRKDSTWAFELGVIRALYSNINLFPFYTVFINFDVTLWDSGPSGNTSVWQRIFFCVCSLYIYKHTHLHAYIYSACRLKKEWIICIPTILSKWINNTCIVVYIQLPVSYIGIKEKGNWEILCNLDTS